MSWLLYDIANETFLRGRALANRDNYKEVAAMYATAEDEGHREKILRTVKKAFTEIRKELSEYLEEERKTANSSGYGNTPDLVLNLPMPSNFNEAATDGIGEAVHDYMKNLAIAEWYLVTNRDEADMYMQLVNKAMLSLQHAVSRRERPHRAPAPEDAGQRKKYKRVSK